MSEAPVCPICRSIYVRPRIYPECGHSLCENCHIQTDEHTDIPDAYTAIVYKCPICRSETLTPWNRRPLNRALDEICSSSFSEEYNERSEELGEAPAPETIGNKEDVDLAKMAIAERNRVATALYDEIFPLLHKTARDGGDYISITSKEKVVRAASNSWRPTGKKIYDFVHLSLKPASVPNGGAEPDIGGLGCRLLLNHFCWL